MSVPLFDPPARKPFGKHAIRIDCEQGGGAWLDLRKGRPTASRFDCIITKKGKRTANAARTNYIRELVVERITGRVYEHYVSKPMEFGTLMEPQARAHYTDATGREVEQVGFILHDSEAYGCSPDGLVGDDGMVEIKVPTTATYLGQIIAEAATEKAYVQQVQAQMWICERAWCDLCIYADEHQEVTATGIKNRSPNSPVFPSRIIRVEADLKYHDALDIELHAFCAEVAEAEARCMARISA